LAYDVVEHLKKKNSRHVFFSSANTSAQTKKLDKQHTGNKRKQTKETKQIKGGG
jgi:hypothetical protein